jgi:nucleoside-diphosphate-sugar epimerase
MVLHTFISKAKKGETIIIQGDGSATRNFVYVDDIVRGNISVINNLEKSKNQTINLCGDSNISIKELANLISGKIKSCKIENTAARTGDHIEPLISNKKANDLLGWTPQVSFEEGIKKSIEWL